MHLLQFLLTVCPTLFLVYPPPPPPPPPPQEVFSFLTLFPLPVTPSPFCQFRVLTLCTETPVYESQLLLILRLRRFCVFLFLMVVFFCLWSYPGPFGFGSGFFFFLAMRWVAGCRFFGFFFFSGFFFCNVVVVAFWQPSLSPLPRPPPSSLFCFFVFLCCLFRPLPGPLTSRPTLSPPPPITICVVDEHPVFWKFVPTFPDTCVPYVSSSRLSLQVWFYVNLPLC